MLEAEFEIIIRAKGGDALAFGQLYDHYAKPIYRFIAIKVDSKEAAEDLTHEVFLSAWQKLDGYQMQGFPFSSWLYKIARNRVIDRYRTRKINLPIEDVSEQIKVSDQSEESLDRSIDLSRAKQAMRKLTLDQQDVLTLRFVEDLTPSEIANIMGKREGAIRIIQHRAISRLRELLEQ